MIKINIIILHFKQITHTGDFPLNGYPASPNKEIIEEVQTCSEEEHFVVSDDVDRDVSEDNAALVEHGMSFLLFHRGVH